MTAPIMHPSVLSEVQKNQFLRELQEILFWDIVEIDDQGHDVEAWNPDKEWHGDALDEIGSLMERYNLRPQLSVEEQKARQLEEGFEVVD